MFFSDITAFSNVCLEYVCLPHLRSTSGHRNIITDCHIGMWNLGIWHTGIPNTARLAVGIPGTSGQYVDAVLRTRREDNCKDSGIPKMRGSSLPTKNEASARSPLQLTPIPLPTSTFCTV